MMDYFGENALPYFSSIDPKIIHPNNRKKQRQKEKENIMLLQLGKDFAMIVTVLNTSVNSEGHSARCIAGVTNE